MYGKYDDIDLDELAKLIKTMSVRSKLYKLLKRELTARGWWKNKPRGRVVKGNLRPPKKNF